MQSGKSFTDRTLILVLHYIKIKTSGYVLRFYFYIYIKLKEYSSASICSIPMKYSSDRTLKDITDNRSALFGTVIERKQSNKNYEIFIESFGFCITIFLYFSE